jgi:hypothetical protein
LDRIRGAGWPGGLVWIVGMTTNGAGADVHVKKRYCFQLVMLDISNQNKTTFLVPTGLDNTGDQRYPPCHDKGESVYERYHHWEQ